MANRVKPPILGPKKKNKKLLKSTKVRKLQSGPTFNLLTILWVDQNGVPFNTTGFYAALYRGSSLIQTAAFDRFGAAYFSQVPTLTTVNYTLQVYDSLGRVYHTRLIPAGVEAFAVIG
ncbi:hypothetical protein [Paenibacillus sp. PL91]|uniref:hypothetical protein n=1 Tax=Paenibacillus sp. PL91 TaxID=2729538 RepID=UPI00145F4E00|nr:hypothetical protein [Paenibacillus sp. PL91]MBC9203600.1 hypothetical protein [Paenibacillus sp. PL91]